MGLGETVSVTLTSVRRKQPPLRTPTLHGGLGEVVLVNGYYSVALVRGSRRGWLMKVLVSLSSKTLNSDQLQTSFLHRPFSTDGDRRDSVIQEFGNFPNSALSLTLTELIFCASFGSTPVSLAPWVACPKRPGISLTSIKAKDRRSIKPHYLKVEGNKAASLAPGGWRRTYGGCLVTDVMCIRF